MGFFRSTNNSVILDAYRGRTETVELSIAERLLLFGPTADNLSELNIDIDEATEDDLNRFKSQTTTTKLKLLLNSEFGKALKNSPKWNKNHILNFIAFADEPKVHQAKGYSTFRINDSGDYGSMKESLTAMLYGYQTNTPQGEMLTIVAEEMIKSHFYLYGINFGRNISKYIDVDLLHAADKYRNPDRHTLQTYANAVRELEKQQLPPNFIDNFYRANANNALFVKFATPTFNYDGTIDDSKPTFRTIGEQMNGDYKNYVNHIIIEERKKLEESYNFNNADYINRNVKGNIVLFKRYIREDSKYVFYYPIYKTLPNEFGYTAIPKFLQFIPKSEEYPDGVNIVTEDNYINAVEDRYLLDVNGWYLKYILR